MWHQLRGDHLDFRCPLPDHPDRDASGSADWHPPSGGRPGAVKLVCHACGLTANSALIAALGLSWVDLFDDAPARPEPSSPRAGRRGTAPRPSRSAPRATPASAPAPAPAPAPDKAAAPRRARTRLVASYVYRDAAGVVVGRCERREALEVDPEKGKRTKTFVWRRPDGAGGWERGMPRPCPLYRLPELLAARAAGAPVWWVEGEKNADALAAAGVVAVSGPNGARSGWRPEYAAELAGADVVVVADRDEPGEAYARQVSAELAGVATSVRVVRTPVEARGADASDHLAAGLSLEQFEPLDPPASEPASTPDASVATSAAEPARPAGDPDRPEAERPGGDLLPFPTRPASSAPGEGQADEDDRPGGGGGGGDGDRPLRRVIQREHFEVLVGEDAVVQVKVRTRGEIEKWEELLELLNARIKITRRIAVDLGDGSDEVSVPRTTHVDLVAERGSERIELLRVPWDEFRRGEYLCRLPWPLRWSDTPSGRARLVNAIVDTSGLVPVVPAYGSLGWREIGGQWVYVHAAGGISAAGTVAGIEVEVSPRLRTFTLPDPPAPGEQLGAALRGVLDVLDQLPPAISAPAMGAPLRAVLGQSRTSVFVVGHTGSRKSGLAALAQQVFMPSARHNRLPVGAGEAASTAAGMEELLWQAGESLVVADDLAPDRGAERSAMRANELLRAAGNGTAKLRGARAGGLRADREPRALPMITGEDGASKASAESRTVYVPLAPGDVPLDTIRGLSTRALIKARNATGAALVAHIAGRMPVEEWVEDTRGRYAAALLAALDPDDTDPSGLDSRRADTVGELAVGWRALLDTALAGQALTPEQAEVIWERVWGGLVECLRAQAEVADRRSLVERAADLLRSSLRSGRAHLEAEAGGAPSVDRLRPCGWRTDEGQFSDVRPGGDAAGWASDDRKYVWLDPGTVFALIERQARAESDPLGVTARALTGALAAAGLLTTEPVAGRAKPVPQVRRRAGGARQRVWELPWSWLWPDEADPAGDGGQSGPPRPSTPPVPPAPPLLDPTSQPGPDGPSAGPEQPATGPAPAARTDGPIPAAPSPAGEEPSTTVPAADSSPDTVAPRPGPATSAPAAEAPHGDLSAAQGQPGPTARYRAAGVVLDVDEAHWIGGPGPLDPPAELDSLPALLAWAETLQLGTAHARTRDDAGQVWLMPALAKRLGMGKAPQKGSSRAVSSHPVVKALSAAGWQVGNRGLQAWTHLWRPAGAGMHVVVVPWLPEAALCDPSNPPPPRQLAERLDVYASMVGTADGESQPYLYSAPSTGTALLKLVRGGAREQLSVVEPPPPAAERGGRLWEPEWSWQRGPTDSERGRPWVVAWDVNAAYLAAAQAAVLGLGPARHATAPTLTGPPAKLPPGYWRIRRDTATPAALEGLPNLLDPAPGYHSGDHIWITTPTLAAALQHGYDVQVLDAWVWDRATRWLETWAHSLRDARYALAHAGAEATPDTPADPELAAVLKAVKLTYSGGIGMLGSEKWRSGKPEYRPDARHHVIGMSKANLFRKCVKAATAGCTILAVERDMILIAADSENPDQAPPPGFTTRIPGDIHRLGGVKWAGAVPMGQLTDALASGPRPEAATLGPFGK